MRLLPSAVQASMNCRNLLRLTCRDMHFIDASDLTECNSVTSVQGASVNPGSTELQPCLPAAAAGRNLLRQHIMHNGNDLL